MTPGISFSDEERSLTAALMVMVSPEGLRLPGLDDAVGGQVRHAPLALGLAELLLLNGLRRGNRPPAIVAGETGAATATPPEALHDFVAALETRGLLTGAVPLHDAPHDTSAWAPAEAIDRSETCVLITPRMFSITPDGFGVVDADGVVRRSLSARELAAASEFRLPSTVARAHESHRASCGAHALDDEAFDELVGRLVSADLLHLTTTHVIGPSAIPVQLPVSRRGRPLASIPAGAFTHTFGRDRFQRLNDAMRESGRAFEAREREHEARTGRKRVKVVSVQHNGTILPLAIGMIVAAAERYDGGRLQEHYAFHPDWLMRPSKARARTQEPGVFLFSNYTWSHNHNLTVSSKVKQLSPWSVTIHGGPNTPKYDADCEAYFRDHPDVDITVRGEGELTVAEVLDALAGRIGDGPADLSPLHDVRGIAFRDGDRIVRTPDRERIADLDSLPSPFLNGVFELYGGNTEMAIVESNRGCPYSCTFCDWGSAINTKVRKFALERVFAELEWCARNEVGAIMVADANFGIYERDVLIAEKVAELKERYGYPGTFSTNFAKNTTTHLKKIIELLTEAGVISTSTMAMQSMDGSTLSAIRRANIKVNEYDKLAAEFRKADLPLSIDLMFGLPGQTLPSFRNDLQGCIDRGVFPRMYMTEMLVNSPMNEPAYREQHRIVTEPSPDNSRHFVVSTATFTRRDYEEMNGLRRVFGMCEIYGMLREVAHYVRAETGMREIDFYDRLNRDARSDPERWPMLTFALRALPALLVPPGSWKPVLDDVRRYVTEVLGVVDDAALATVLSVQLAVLPQPSDQDETPPILLRLPHDFASWHQAVVEAKENGHQHDWPAFVPQLRRFGPATFGAGDRDRIGDFGIGLALYGVQPETSITVRPQLAVNGM